MISFSSFIIILHSCLN